MRKMLKKYLKQKKHVKTIQYSVGGSSPVISTGRAWAIMVEYDNDTPNFDEKWIRLLKILQYGFKHPGRELEKSRLINSAGNPVQVTVKGPSMDAKINW